MNPDFFRYMSRATSSPVLFLDFDQIVMTHEHAMIVARGDEFEFTNVAEADQPRMAATIIAAAKLYVLRPLLMANVSGDVLEAWAAVIADMRGEVVHSLVTDFTTLIETVNRLYDISLAEPVQ